MSDRRLIFRVHAIQRMFARRVSEPNVRQVLESGQMVENYSDDMPFPSGLILGRSGNRSFHVVIAGNLGDKQVVVITVYEPDPSQWRAHLKSRKP